jgi:hypothetical protein
MSVFLPLMGLRELRRGLQDDPDAMEIMKIVGECYGDT